MAKEGCIRHFSWTKSGKMNLNTMGIKTKFRSIEGLALNEAKNRIFAYGVIKNQDRKDIKKVEIFNLETKKSLANQTISFKIK